MENNEYRTDILPEGQNKQIQLVLNNTGEEDSIDLGNVFRNMKQKKRLFAWVS